MAEVDSIAALCLKGVDPEEVAEIGYNAESWEEDREAEAGSIEGRFRTTVELP